MAMYNHGLWSEEEKMMCIDLAKQYGPSVKVISEMMKTRSPVQIMNFLKKCRDKEKETGLPTREDVCLLDLRSKQVASRWTEAEQKLLETILLNSNSDVETIALLFPGRSIAAIKSRIESIKCKETKASEEDSVVIIEEQANSKKLRIDWTKADEDTLVEIMKEHGRDYDLMAKVTGFSRKQCQRKVYKMKNSLAN